MNPPGSVEDLQNYILREIPKTRLNNKSLLLLLTRFMDFGLLYVVLNDVRMADISLGSLVYG